MQRNLHGARRRNGGREDASLEFVRVCRQQLVAVLGEERDNVQLPVLKGAILQQAGQAIDVIEGVDITFKLKQPRMGT